MIHVLTSVIYTVCMHSKLTCSAWMKEANPVQVQEMESTEKSEVWVVWEGLQEKASSRYDGETGSSQQSSLLPQRHSVTDS